MSKPPPPRYKIVERDGRLVTTDTWAENGTPAAPSVPSRRDFIAESGGIGAPLVAALLRIRDAQGRRLLTTSPRWDRKGPRVIALSLAGERRLGAALLLAVIGFAFAVLLAVIDIAWLMPLMVLAVVLAGSLSSMLAGTVTRLLDSLGEDLPR